MQVTETKNASGVFEANRKPGDSMGKDDFLNLLITQLKNQDPLKPMEDKEFIVQMTQFSTLEQMQNLAQVSRMQQATGMIGKDIKAEVYKDKGMPELVYGRVTSIRQSGSDLYLSLNDGSEIKVDDVAAVLGEEGLIQEALNLVGKKVLVREYGPDGSTIDVVPVTIQDVKLEEGVLKLFVDDNGTYIRMKDIWNIIPEDASYE